MGVPLQIIRQSSETKFNAPYIHGYHQVVKPLAVHHRLFLSAQSLQEPLRDQPFHIALSNVELTVLRQIDNPVSTH
jgi:hypothetical protein